MEHFLSKNGNTRDEKLLSIPHTRVELLAVPFFYGGLNISISGKCCGAMVPGLVLDSGTCAAASNNNFYQNNCQQHSSEQ